MTRTTKYRGLASIALQRLSESDLRSLHAQISEISPGAFVELIRDIEDEIENSMSLTLQRSIESSYPVSAITNLFNEIDQIRKKDLRLPVQPFTEMLSDTLAQIPNAKPQGIPPFDSRRGLQAWLIKLSRIFSEQEIFHALMRIKSKNDKPQGSDWRLR